MREKQFLTNMDCGVLQTQFHMQPCNQSKSWDPFSYESVVILCDLQRGNAHLAELRPSRRLITFTWKNQHRYLHRRNLQGLEVICGFHSMAFVLF